MFDLRFVPRLQEKFTDIEKVHANSVSLNNFFEGPEGFIFPFGASLLV